MRHERATVGKYNDKVDDAAVEATKPGRERDKTAGGAPARSEVLLARAIGVGFRCQETRDEGTPHDESCGMERLKRVEMRWQTRMGEG